MVLESLDSDDARSMWPAQVALSVQGSQERLISGVSCHTALYLACLSGTKDGPAWICGIVELVETLVFNILFLYLNLRFEIA